MRKLILLSTLFLIALMMFPLIPTQSESTQTLTPIRHVVIIILENHSFDSLFGTYPFGNPPLKNNVTCSLMRPIGLNLSVKLPNGNGGFVTPFQGSVILQDPTEGFTPYHEDWNYGLMNGFVEGSGQQSMAYVTYKQIPLLWDYAEEYVLADDYFSPVLETTQPNRLAYLTGFSTNVTGDGFVSGVIPFCDTIMYQLSEYDVSWAYFDYGYTGGVLSPFPLSAFNGNVDYSSYYFNTSVFLQDLHDGKLPSVSWLMFTGGDGYDTHSALDFHPPFNLTVGQENLVKYIDAIMQSPYWNSTAIFITFDEGGGFYDQVPPPIIYTYGEGNDKFLQGLGISNYSVLGERTPLLIISPYSREGWIDNYTLSGYTLLGFIDYNWHLPYLDQIVAHSDVQGLLKAFDFSKLRQPILLYPSNWSYPIPLQYPVHYGYVATIHNNYTSYQILYQKGYINSSVLSYVMKFSSATDSSEQNLTNVYNNVSNSTETNSSLISKNNVSKTNITTMISSLYKETEDDDNNGISPIILLYVAPILIVISLIGLYFTLRKRK
ncbi:alkaline phosphatase family protein [Sulfuracidifex metallicus DSM 6482 = JCM 9184]|nr:alkaline phosphatase family protein [Sulfuracidifex metallicus DSM 6482 = JCM 9184]